MFCLSLMAFLLGHTILCEPLAKSETVNRVRHNVALAGVEALEILIELSLGLLQNVRILIRDCRRAGSCRGTLGCLPLSTLGHHRSNKPQQGKKMPVNKNSQTRLEQTMI